jgi:hypothetical protein
MGKKFLRAEKASASEKKILETSRREVEKGVVVDPDRHLRVSPRGVGRMSGA